MWTIAAYRRTHNVRKLAWFEGWQPPGWRSVYIHQLNRVNFRNCYGYDDSTIEHYNITIFIIVVIS